MLIIYKGGKGVRSLLLLLWKFTFTFLPLEQIWEIINEIYVIAFYFFFLFRFILFLFCFSYSLVSVYINKSCAEAFKSGGKISGVYKIDPDGLGHFEVYCDQTTAGGGWTVFQRRQDGSVDFYRDWDAYKRGFGNLKGEFWLGLDKIHRLTVKDSKKLRVDLEDNLGNTAFAEYSSISVASEQAKYQLRVGTYSGVFNNVIGPPSL